MKKFAKHLAVLFSLVFVLSAASCDLNKSDSDDSLLYYLLFQSNAYVRVYNNTSTTVCYFYTVPNYSSSWGYDLFGYGVTVAPGEYSYYYSVGSGYRDFKLATCGGSCSYLFDYNVVAGSYYHIDPNSWGSCTYGAPGIENAEGGTCQNATLVKEE